MIIRLTIPWWIACTFSSLSAPWRKVGVECREHSHGVCTLDLELCKEYYQHAVEESMCKWCDDKQRLPAICVMAVGENKHNVLFKQQWRSC